VTKRYAATVKDASGREQAFSIEIDEKRQTGSMVWPFETSQLTKVRVTAARDRVQCLVRWTTMTLRCIVRSETGGGTPSIVVTLAGTSERYQVVSEDGGPFTAFVRGLSVPEEPAMPFEETGLREDLPIGDAKLPTVHWSLFFAHRPADPEISFAQVNINGIPVDVSQQYALPGNQGKYLSLGDHDPNRRLLITWEVMAAMTGGVTELIVGYFPDGSLSKRIVLDRFAIESFSNYPGAGTVPK
jgi:hypothetical protein